MQVVINTCYGGFGLSYIAHQLYAKKKGITLTFYKQTKYSFQDGRSEYTRVNPKNFNSNKDLTYHMVTKDLGPKIPELPNDDTYWYPEIERNDPILLEVIKELGVSKCNSRFSDLKVVDIPDNVDWELTDYDGIESIHERSRSWR